VKRVVMLTLATLMLAPIVALSAPTSAPERRLNPGEISSLPSFVRRVEPAIVGLRVRNSESAASSSRLGSRRFGSGVIFDARGYALTVSYLLLDAIEVEARGRDGRTVAARVVGFDLDTGLGVVKLEGEGPWPVAALGDSRADRHRRRRRGQRPGPGDGRRERGPPLLGVLGVHA
jgi:S1-C subfamily serine protease